MKWEKYKVPLLQLGLIVTSAVAIISLASVFILDARIKNIQEEETVVRENSAASTRAALEQKLMVYGSSDDKALVMRDSLPMQGLAGDELVFNEAEDVFASNDADGHYYVWRVSDGELLTTFANVSYDRALLIGSNRILLEDNGYFYCFDYTSGLQLWKWQFPYEECVWEYNGGTETIYIMSKSPDKVTQTVQTASYNDDGDDDWDDDDWDDHQSTTEQIVSLTHDIYVLSLSELTVNYIRPEDLLADERTYETATISDMSLSDDRTMLLLNGSLSDPDYEYDKYFSRIYEIGDLVFEVVTPTLTSEEDGEDDESAQTGSAAPVTQTSEIVKGVSAAYNESIDPGYRMMTRWIDNESLLQYSEDIETGEDTDGEEQGDRDEWDDEDTDDAATSHTGIAANIIGGTDSEPDELDEEPESVGWYVRKRTLPYASTAWKISGKGLPTDSIRLYSYTEEDEDYLILTLSQCAVTLNSESGQEVSSVIDINDFVYVEPKGVRPTMYITNDGTVVQGKRHYGLGVSDIFAAARLRDIYYISSQNSVYRYTMAGNLADSGTILTGSDETVWNKAVFSADGRYVALSGQRYLSMYNAENGSRLYQNVCSVSTGPDAVFIGNVLCHIDSSGRSFMVYDPAGTSPERIPLPGAVTMQNSEIRSAGSRYVLIAGESGQIAWIYDAEEKDIVQTLKIADFCNAAGLAPVGSEIAYCQMSPDARYLVYSVRVTDSAGAQTLRAFVMDRESGKTAENEQLAEKLDVPANELKVLNTSQRSFSDDGKYALFVGNNNSVAVLDLGKAAFAQQINCGELTSAPVFMPDGNITCVTQAGDLIVLKTESGEFIAVDEENTAVTSEEVFSMDRPGSSVQLTFSGDGKKMYARGLKNGKSFIRVYSISEDSVLTPETEIPSAVTGNTGVVLMRYGENEAEIFPYLSLEELEQRAAAEG